MNEDKKETKYRFFEISDLLFAIWSFYVITPIIATAQALQSHKCSLSFTIFIWIFWSGILFFLFLSVWKKENALIIIIKPFILILLSYVFFAYLSPSLAILSPVFFSINVIWAIFGIYWIVESVYKFLKLILSAIKRKYRPRNILKSPLRKKVLYLFIIWIFNVGFSYMGYFDSFIVEDRYNPDFMISFFGAPPGGINSSAYNSGQYDEDFKYFSKMHTSFYIGLGEKSGDDYIKELEYCIDFFVKHNTSVVIVGIPYDEEHEEGEMMNYWTVDMVNRSFIFIENWMMTLNESVLSGIRGISFDVEDPNVEIYDISGEQYYIARDRYQEMFDHYHELFPDKEIISILGKEVLYDYFDGDKDLDIRLFRISQPPIWDVYGCMTYEAGSATPAFTPYRFYYECLMGYEQFGLKFQPWVGWFDSPDSAGPGDVIENPDMLEVVLTDVKIAKSFGFKEVVLAPSYNYFGDESGRLMRLRVLSEIIDGFSPIKIRIMQNRRIYTSPERYIRRLKPGRIMGWEEPALDILSSWDRSSLPLINAVIALWIIIIHIAYKRGFIKKPEVIERDKG